MKKLLILCFIVFVAVSCKKKDDKTSGICYCDFANGKKQEYDLRHLSSRGQQVDTCALLNKNAGGFGGVCELK